MSFIKPTRSQTAWYIKGIGTGVILGAIFSAWMPFVVINFLGLLVMVGGQMRADWTKNDATTA